MIFDNIFQYIGDFGRGQIIQYFLLCWPFMIAGFLSVDVVFLMAVPKFVCQPNNATLSSIQVAYNLSSNGEIADLLINLMNKYNQDKQNCYQWSDEVNLVELLGTIGKNSSILSNQTLTSNLTCKGNFMFSELSFGKTIPNEFNLICDRSYLRDNLKTIFFVGRIVGALLFGQVSDLIGRLSTFLIVVLCNVAAGVGLYFSKNVIMIGAFLLFQGFTQLGYTLTTFVLGCEMVGVSKRKWTGTVLQFFYSAAFILIPLCYLGVWNWRYLALLSGVPSLIFLTYYFVIFESPRWLLTKGRSEKVLKIVETVAKRNNRIIPAEVKESILKHQESPEYLKDKGKRYSILDLLNTKNMFFLTINVCFNWIVNSLIYYGIIFNTENLGGSLYINFILMGLVEIPAYVLNLLLLDVIGRRNLLIGSLWLTGVACLIAGFIPKKYTITIAVIAMIGKLTVTMSYGVIYFFTTELFPTVVRNVGMGTASMSARIGGTLAVPILSLQSIYRPLPMIVFFVLSGVAGALTFLIPETSGQQLDQHLFSKTNEEADKNDENKSPETLELMKEQNV